MKVCIAEKPSVAGEIAKVLGARARKDGYFEGNGYQVTWTFGHLCTLKMPGEYYSDWKKWSLSNLPMIPPRYEVRLIDDAGIRKQFKVIKELYKHADVIINCGDAGGRRAYPAMGYGIGRSKMPCAASLDLISY